MGEHHMKEGNKKQKHIRSGIQNHSELQQYV